MKREKAEKDPICAVCMEETWPEGIDELEEDGKLVEMECCNKILHK